jgi:urocanate hydratase
MDPIRQCLGWEQEGALRCLLNNLDPAVAEDAERFVVYGGEGKAIRDAVSLEETVAALKRLRGDQTLLIQSGRPVAILPTHEDAPRVLISTAMLVPEWSTFDHFWELERAGLTMYGQMTAAGWFYIGTQGILGFTHETFHAVAERHFGGTLQGKRVLTAGLGGMGGAQGLGVTNNGGVALVVEVNPEHARRRLHAGWIDHLTTDYDEAVALIERAASPMSVGLVGNIAEIAPRLVEDGVHFDIATDQTAAHDRLRGYIPAGWSVEDAQRAESGDAAYLGDVDASLRAHVTALLRLKDRGTVIFEYGNNLRRQAFAAGVEKATTIPGFVAEYVRPILSQGKGPFRWICLSGDPEDLRRTEEAVLAEAGTPGMHRWFEMARSRVVPQGLPARICWLGLGERDAVSLRINELVRAGEIGPVAIGRDHMDPASVASPSRETEKMRDHSDAIADWPVLTALLNAAQGATWVAIGNGGGVGIGRSIHSGMVLVADGSDLAERKIRRTFWSDAAIGVARYADAGYPDALAVAREHHLDLPHSVPDARRY